MICAYLMYVREWDNADDAMKFYGFARTNDQKGVTIPSQRRFIRYFAELLELHDGEDCLPPDAGLGISRDALKEEIEYKAPELISGEENDTDSEDEGKAKRSDAGDITPPEEESDVLGPLAQAHSECNFDEEEFQQRLSQAEIIVRKVTTFGRQQGFAAESKWMSSAQQSFLDMVEEDPREYTEARVERGSVPPPKPLFITELRLHGVPRVSSFHGFGTPLQTHHSHTLPLKYRASVQNTHEWHRLLVNGMLTCAVCLSVCLMLQRINRISFDQLRIGMKQS
jgi:hypothetical protein